MINGYKVIENIQVYFNAKDCACFLVVSVSVTALVSDG